jgi:predicted PurR-regulated permease PerM
VTSREIRRLIVFGVVVTAATGLLLWTLYLIRSTLLLVYVSALFAIGIAPLVQLIEQQRLLALTRRLPRPLAILLIYTAVLGLIAGVGMAVVPPLIQQGQDLWQMLPQRIDAAQAWLVKLHVLEAPITFVEAVQHAPAGGADAVSTLLGAVFGFVGGLFGVLTILLLTFYLLVESKSLFGAFVRFFPRNQRGRVAELSADVATKVSAWLGGQILLSLVIGLTSTIGLYLLGVPYFYVLALISAIGELIPMVGPIVAAIPAILVALSVSPGVALAVAIFYIIQQQLENAVLVPRIMGRQVGMSAAGVIIALGVGSELLGLVGAILAIPTAAILQTVFRELQTHDEGGAAHEPPLREPETSRRRRQT